MRLIVKWSCGDFESMSDFVVPFEYDSPEDLDEILSSRRKEYDESQAEKWKANELFVTKKITAIEFLEKCRAGWRHPEPIFDITGRRALAVDYMRDSSGWAGVEIYTIDEWFESQ